jgi:uncharacterized membrane-anchored protein YitT (DUF2179 family)
MAVVVIVNVPVFAFAWKVAGQVCWGGVVETV